MGLPFLVITAREWKNRAGVSGIKKSEVYKYPDNIILAKSHGFVKLKLIKFPTKNNGL